FPEEVEKFRSDAEKDAAAGKTPSIFAALTQGGNGARGAARGQPNPNVPARADGDQEEVMRQIVARLFADPYGWIQENEGRLSTLKVSDDAPTVLVDGKPVA